MSNYLKIPHFLWLSVVFGLFFAGTLRAESICFSCHEQADFNGGSVHSPVASGKCTACHNPHVARFEGLLAKPLAKLCFSCHAKGSTTLSGKVVHQPVKEGKCLACHDAHSASGKGLIRGALADICFECHKGLEKQYKVTHRPYAKGQCSSCHNPHGADNTLLLRAKAPDDLCYSCHKKERVAQRHANYPVKVKDCLSCHNPHGSSQKGLVRDVSHSPYKKKNCSACHRKGQASTGIDVCLECHKNVMAGMYKTHSHLAIGKGNSCIQCHAPHAGDTKALLKGHLVSVCRNCHEDTFKRQEERLYVHVKAVNECGKCHDVHGSNRMAMLSGDGNSICVECHAAQGAFTHPVGDKVFDPRTGHVMTCVTCHNPHGTDYKNHLRLSGTKTLCVQCHKFEEGR